MYTVTVKVKPEDSTIRARLESYGFKVNLWDYLLNRRIEPEEIQAIGPDYTDAYILCDCIYSNKDHLPPQEVFKRLDEDPSVIAFQITARKY